MILHIGLAKAASTFLQKEVFCNVKSLSFYGPSSPTAEEIRHKLRSGGEDLPDVRRAIVSDEGLSIRQDINGISVHQKICEEYDDVKVLFILRDQIDWLKSRYREDYRTFMGRYTDFYSFQNWLNGDFHRQLSNFEGREHANLYMPRERIKYDKIIETYIEYDVDLHIHFFENMKGNMSDEIERILDSLNLRVPKFEVEDHNRSMNETELILDRYLKRITGGPGLIEKVFSGRLPNILNIDYNVDDATVSQICETNKTLDKWGYSLPDKYMINTD